MSRASKRKVLLTNTAVKVFIGIGQGRENAKEYLKNNPTVAADIEQKIMEVSGLQRGPAGA